MWKIKKDSKVIYLIFIVLLVALVTWTYVTGAQAMPTGSTEIEYCVKTEGAPPSVVCEPKTVVTVPVSYGVETTMEAVTAGETVTIEVTKTKPRLIYPFTYFHTASYFPYEQVIKVPNQVPGQMSCVHCPDSDCPTCGWTLDGQDRIEDSQGFCCNKDVELLSNPNACFRGEELLPGPSTALDSYSTAHSLRRGDLFYHGYEISEFHKTYDITVTHTKGLESHTFVVSPEDPFYGTEADASYSGNITMKAQLLGDLADYRGAPELDNYILYIPAIPDSHEYVQNYHQNMLLVPREEVSRDGCELDKVAVSFHTLRMMGGNCRATEAGDGLHNQLFHKHNSDLQKLAQDAETTYLVHGKKVFKGSMSFQAGMEKFLEHSIPDINYSLLSLTIDADTLRMVETESAGIIVDADIETFTSMSDEGTLNVTIQNTGTLRTNYIVTVTQPNMNIIRAIPAQASTLDPTLQDTLSFDVYTAYNIDESNTFLVTLKSPTGRIYDSTTVDFNTTEHPTNYSWELQEKNDGSHVNP